MHRELLSHPYIGSYRAFLLLAFIFGYWVARQSAKRTGIERRHIDNVLLLLPIFGLAGGRFFSRYFYYPEPLTFWQALKVWEDGGLVFYGGLIFGILTVLVYTLVRRVPVFPFLDALAPAVAVGLAFGRVGCFMAGCCWGDLCVEPSRLNGINSELTRSQVQTFPSISSSGFFLSVQYPKEAGAYEQHQALGLIGRDASRSLPVHPVQLYEATAVLILGFLLFRSLNRKKLNGEIFWVLGMSYGSIRFFMEFLRADSRPIYFGGTTISQAISLLIILVCLLSFAGRRYYLGRSESRLRPLPVYSGS